MTQREQQQLRAELVRVGRRAYEAGFVPATDGNLSVRCGNLLLATPSGINKGHLDPDQLVLCDMDGSPVGEGQPRPSSEIRMHMLVYRARPDVQAAIHAHPAHAVALSLVGVSLAECLLPETALALGPIPTTPYATPTTDDVPASISQHLSQGYNALILARHGTLTLGETIEQAYDRLETLEHTARITLLARSVGATTPLPDAEVDKIEEIARSFGIARPNACSSCGTCGQPPQSRPSRSADNADLVSTIAGAVLRRLSHDRVKGDTNKR